jgi:hypothetical protein
VRQTSVLCNTRLPLISKDTRFDEANYGAGEKNAGKALGERQSQRSLREDGVNLSSAPEGKNRPCRGVVENPLRF